MFKSILPQTQGVRFVTDGGLETTAIFIDGLDLPAFSSISLMKEPKGQSYLIHYFTNYLALANSMGYGFILESPTWRASSDWAKAIGVSQDELMGLNRSAIELMNQLKAEYESEHFPVLVSGCIGPRGDGYQIDKKMDVNEAKNYHFPQMKAMSDVGTDFISALTINYEEEALGIVLAAKDIGTPLCLSFTVETDGKLPTGRSLEEAISYIDSETDNYVSYFMINCAHPTHFAKELKKESQIIHRIGGLRVNASCKSHAELDNSVSLDAGNPTELASQLSRLEKEHPNITVLGGCCGTDIRHIEQICLQRRRFR